MISTTSLSGVKNGICAFILITDYTMPTYSGSYVTLESVESEKDIGVTIDSKLNFEKTYPDTSKQGKSNSWDNQEII
jgi:hypothetical protein